MYVYSVTVVDLMGEKKKLMMMLDLEVVGIEKVGVFR